MAKALTVSTKASLFGDHAGHAVVIDSGVTAKGVLRFSDAGLDNTKLFVISANLSVAVNAQINQALDGTVWVYTADNALSQGALSLFVPITSCEKQETPLSVKEIWEKLNLSTRKGTLFNMIYYDMPFEGMVLSGTVTAAAPKDGGITGALMQLNVITRTV